MSGVLSDGVEDDEGMDSASGDMTSSSPSSIASSEVSWASASRSGSKRAVQAFQISWAPMAAMGSADLSRESGDEGGGPEAASDAPSAGTPSWSAAAVGAATS